MAAGISQDGGIVVIEQLGCYPVDNVRLLFPAGQLAAFRPHVLGVDL